MTCEATWIVASFQSTIDPFIQIFPVPANAMMRKLYGTWDFGLGSWVLSLLAFPAEGTHVGTRRQRLAAFPAELRLLRFAGFQACLDLLHFFRWRRGGGRRRGTPRALDRRRRAGGEHRFEQFGGALITR